MDLWHGALRIMEMKLEVEVEAKKNSKVARKYRRMKGITRLEDREKKKVGR